MNSFKKSKRKPIRKREYSSGSEDEDETNDTLSTVSQLQKMRQRQKGVSADDLAATKVEKKEVVVEDDPYKMKTGGYVDMKKMNAKRMRGTQEEFEAVSGTSFAAETNCRDEDADMLKYVQGEMERRRGANISEDETAEQSSRRKSTGMDELYQLPDHLKNITGSIKRNENMLSNQMLSGIPEIDLGIEAKIKNIEQTEDAKVKLIQDRLNRKNEDTTFVPTNMAVNFVQHNRFNIEENNAPKKKPEPLPKVEPVRVGELEGNIAVNDDKKMKGGNQKKGDRATDDFHFEKFRKQVRRY